MFLTGAGQTLLAMPLLTSLLPREARAASKRPLRFVMFTNHGSPSEKGFFGQYYGSAASLGLATAAGNVLTDSVSYRALSQMSGDMSYILAPFTAMKNQVTVIRGLDSMALERGPHPSGFASAATGFGTSRSTFSGQLSIDTLIAQRLMPKGVPASRLKMTLHPRYTGSVGLSGVYQEQNATITGSYALSPNFDGSDITRATMVRSMTKTAQILATFFSSGQSKAEVIDRRGLMNAVFADYQRVRNSRNIGADDRRTLDAFMATIADVEDGIEFESSGLLCQPPTLENDFPPPFTTRLPNESNSEYVARSTAAYLKWKAERAGQTSDLLWRNHSKLVAAAFACDLQKVASFAMGQVGSHAYHHSSGLSNATPTSSADAKAYFDAQRSMASRVAAFMDVLKSIPEETGTLLDNTLIYWNQNYGCVYSSGGGHSRKNFPVVLAGGAQGKLKMGYYIDYRFQMGESTRGLPLNNLLVTMMSLYGVTPLDYEFKSNTGYGSYDGFGQSMPSNVTDLTGKRALLPFLVA